LSAAIQDRSFDVLIVGAGFAGLYALHRMRTLGLRARVLEAGAGIGGTWYWNRYPGARCDIESLQYSYSFSEELQQEWEWSERYATQPDILRYIEHVASKLDLYRDIVLNTRVEELEYEAVRRQWTLTTATERMAARFVIMATGCLSIPIDVAIPGVESFEGKVYRTSNWPHAPVDFRGLRVGMVGTGSSGVQIAPVLARDARHLTVFQRTPNYSIPAHNRTLEPEFIRQWKAEYPARRRAARLGRNFTVNDAGTVPGRNHTVEQREREFERRWNETGGIGFMYAFPDMTTDAVVNEHASEFVKRRIREIVRDQEVASLLCPQDYGIGGKRICVDTGYFEIFNRPNVSLVDLKKDSIVRVTATGIATRSRETPLDAIVLALGFDAMTGALLKVDIRGRDGISLRDRWRDGPRTYLGLAVSDFPNLFIITGPGSPSVFANMVTSIEQHVDWIAGCMLRMRERGYTCIEATAKAEADWVAHVAEVGAPTALAKASNSWYVGANLPGKPRVVMPYMGGAPQYEEICQRVAAEGYEGFVRA
jgi:cyclohexanone monooxygenase